VRRRAAARAWIAAAAVLAAAGYGFADESPRVRVVATGGTIARAPEGWLSAEQLVARLPAGLPAAIEAETFARGPSTALPLDDWLALSRRLHALFEADRTLSGVVVTAGTDTLEELAWFLYLTVSDVRPVVVTGAMRRPAAAGADGLGNLADGIRLAASADARGLGTVVVMHGRVLAARDVRKVHTRSLPAFDAAPPGRIGDIRGTRVRVMRPAARGVAPGSLAPPAGTRLPRVDIVLTYQGAGGELIAAAVAAGARGLVLASAGAGSLTPAQIEAARRAARSGIPVIVASRVGRGPIGTLRYTPAGAPLFSAGDLQPLKARLLLMLGLARGMPPADLEQLFR
jgi:L-asparaginase